MLRYIIFITLLQISFSASSQSLTQTVRGTVTDKITGQPLPGSTIVIVNSSPLTGSATNENGEFRLTNVPVGRHSFRITFLGYKEMMINDYPVNSGKEVVLNIGLEEDFITGKEVVITDRVEKNKPINEMAVVSARTFSVEETQKYAAAVNDPGRMSTSFAGVIGTDDGNNDISIRGNSPTGVLWRMEGVEIPNPNHFSNAGAAGGGISILSAQVLSNSDFMTSAFPAEYGNALSGVFDLKLRKGNNEKREYTIQAGLLGIDLATEGYFKKGYNGSYLINYRYSTLSLLNNLGVNVGGGVTNFQDLSFNVYLPAGKAGNFSLFGFGGLSNQKFDASKDSTKWNSTEESYNTRFTSNTGAVGITHSFIAGKNTYIKSVLSSSIFDNGWKADKVLSDYSVENRYNEYTAQKRSVISSTLNHKMNARQNIRAGVILTRHDFNIHNNGWEPGENRLVTTIKDKGNGYTLQAFAQSSYKLTEKLTMNGGLHYFEFMLNSSRSIEPRASVSYAIDEKQSVSGGYGLHSRLQPLGIYFFQTNGRKPNHDLELSKSHQFVLSYDRMLSADVRIKAETYYQSLYNIPVRADVRNSFSMVNIAQGYAEESLSNNGKGRNYGIDFTLEQFMRNNMYYLFCASLYDAEYQGSDQVWRNSRYNGTFSFAFTGGKEFEAGNRGRVFGVNVKTIYRGGFRQTPVDVNASRANGGIETIYFDDLAYTDKLPNYFRTDIRLSLKKNRENSTRTLSLDIQNVTNNKNIFGTYFDARSGNTKTYYQTGLIPILSYKLEF